MRAFVVALVVAGGAPLAWLAWPSSPPPAVVVNVDVETCEETAAPLERELANAPGENTKSFSITNAGNTHLVFSATTQMQFARCINTTTGVPVFIVNQGDANTSAGVGPFCDTCIGGPALPPLGDAFLRSSVAGPADVRCGFVESWPSGMSLSAPGVGIGVGAADARYVNVSGDTMTGALSIPDGSSNPPAINFASEPSAGIYRPAAGRLGISVGGTEQLDITASRCLVIPQLQQTDGTAAAPGYGFFSDTSNNTGIFRVGEDDIGFSTNGTQRADISTSAFTSTLPIDLVESAAPSVSASGRSRVYPDSTSHVLNASVNGDNFAMIERSTESNLSANATNATATLADSGLAITLDTTGLWECEAWVATSESTAADGAQLKWLLSGITATRKARALFFVDDGGTIATTSTGTLLVLASTTSAWAHLHEFMNVTVTGTVKVQFAQNAHTTGTLTMNAGSYLSCKKRS